jgi:translation initiation factor 5
MLAMFIQDPCKYFGCELGAQTQMDAKNERYIVNGAHDGDRLQDLLDGFIKKFVLCPDCENPETVLHVDRKRAIHQGCQACGYQGTIGPRHKLTTFIQNHPPEGSSSSGKREKDKKERRTKNPKEEMKEQSMAADNGQVVVVDKPVKDDDEEWSADTSAEAVRERMQELSTNAAGLTVTADTEQPLAVRIEAFFAFVKVRKDRGRLLKEATNVLSEAKRLDVVDKGAMVVAEVVFDKNILSQIKEYKKLFLRFVHENKKAQKYLLGAVEQIVGVDHPDLMSRVPHILKALYDEDLLEEEVILEWAQKASKKYVDKKISAEIHEKASPFINWLRDAEEETSDEDVEVVYTNKPEEVGAEEGEEVKNEVEQVTETDEINIEDI